MPLNQELASAVYSSLSEELPSYPPLGELPRDYFEQRKLAADVISAYPWPIGIELRRLFSAGMEVPGRARLEQLFRAMERSMQMLCFILLAQIADESRERSLELTDYFREKFPGRFSLLTLGNLAWLIRSLANIFVSNDINPFLPQTKKLFTNEFHFQLQEWAKRRNEISHHLVQLPQAEIEHRCVDYQQNLIEMLQSLAFLACYPMLTVSEIRVVKSKNDPPRYEHECKLLNTISSDFILRSHIYDTFTENNCVVIARDVKNLPESYLNLSPLIIDTHTETLDSSEKVRTLKKDIFLYNKTDGNQLHYLGTEVQEKCDLRGLSFYPRLLCEFQDILDFSK